MADIRDLIGKCKDEEVFTQNLQDNLLEMTADDRQGRVTFATDPQIVYDTFTSNSPKIGIVIWFPGDVFER